MSNRKIAKMEDNGQNIHAPDKVSANTCLTNRMCPFWDRILGTPLELALGSIPTIGLVLLPA